MDPVYLIDNDRSKKIEKILEFYKIRYEKFRSIERIKPGGCLVCNCDVFYHNDRSDAVRESIIKSFSHIFLFNISFTSKEVLTWLTKQKIDLSVVPLEADVVYTISDKHNEICSYISGESFHQKKSGNEKAFIFKSSGYEGLIHTNGKPVLIYCEVGGCKIFASTQTEFIDIEAKVPSGYFKMSECFSEFIPIFMFLKYSLKDAFWHASQEFACFIIDDPLLKSNYGFVNYDRLLNLMQEHKFSTNIAFIPYNCRRSDNRIALMFNERKDLFSISIHGCDHCEAEFDIINEEQLNSKLQLSLERMEVHRKTTKIDHNKVMIFPKGVFSSNSLKALKANNFSGAINSKALPDNVLNLRVSSFLNPAIIDFGGFPLFIRRYPKSFSDFALDLFMDKPIFFVEHHEYLKDGGRALCEFVGKLNGKFKDLKWENPQKILENFYLIQKDGDTNIVRFFSKDIKIKNSSDSGKLFKITKSDDGAVALKNVNLNGKTVKYQIENELIIIEHYLAPNEEIFLTFAYENTINTTIEPGIIYKYKVLLRRFLTEIRDNYMLKNKFLLQSSNLVKTFVKKFVA